MEEVVSLPAREQTTLTNLIRDLTDLVPANLTIFMNFTPRPGGQIEEVSSYITPAVWSRVREHIVFKQLEGESVRTYITDLLNAPKFRPEEFKDECPDRLFPFAEESLQVLTNIVTDRAVPRHINEACSLVLERALMAGVLDREQARIDVSFVEGMDDQIEALLEHK
jgi:hypothetical protein